MKDLRPQVFDKFRARPGIRDDGSDTDEQERLLSLLAALDVDLFDVGNQFSNYQTHRFALSFPVVATEGFVAPLSWKWGMTFSVKRVMLSMTAS